MFNMNHAMQMLQQGGPDGNQQLMNMLMQQANNPVIKNAMQMVEKNDHKGIETLARNMAKEKGVNVDEALTQIKKQLGL